MIHKILIDLENNITTDIVDQLSDIDLKRDVVIVYKFSKHKNKEFLNEVEFDVDGFNIKTIENLHLKPVQGTRVFFEYPRIRMMLPLGIFPMFESIIPGLKIRTKHVDIVQGVQVSQELKYNDNILNFRGEAKYYSIYTAFQFILEQYDFQGFDLKKYKGNILPLATPIIKFRLIPHFISSFPEIRNVYLICSSYIHDRFPNF